VTETVPETCSFDRSRSTASSVTGLPLISPTTVSDWARARRTASGSTRSRATQISPFRPAFVLVRGAGQSAPSTQ